MRPKSRYHTTLFRPLAAIITAALLSPACDYKPPVVGQADVLVIITSDEDRPLLEPLLMEIFGRTMATPSPEPFFKVLMAPPEKFERYRYYNSLIVASVANPADSSGDLLTRRILGPEREMAALAGGNPIFVARDFLARGQMFMGILALDAIQAQTELERLGSWVFDQFEDQLRVRQKVVVFRKGENKDLSDSLAAEFGWQMRLEKDYLRIKDRPEDAFVWLGRGYPYRWLSVHWVERADSVRLSREWAWRRMELIAGELFAIMTIDSLFRTSELGIENEHEILILRGVWAHTQQVAGGPFVTYVFRDREQHRIYMVTGLVFHPAGNKVLLIKRQEIMIRTFHTFDEPPVAKVASGRNLT